MKDKTNLIFLILIIAVIGGGFYWYFKTQDSEWDLTQMAGDAEFGKEFIDTINKVKKLKIDTAFFESEVFKSLKDASSEINPPETTGKRNPFLSLY
ncbi:hypothetical protein ACFLZC_02120 [Patescibacteria group bacterium]